MASPGPVLWLLVCIVAGPWLILWLVHGLYCIYIWYLKSVGLWLYWSGGFRVHTESGLPVSEVCSTGGGCEGFRVRTESGLPVSEVC